MFNKILIANRGEVALRIMRACKELGVKTVASTRPRTPTLSRAVRRRGRVHRPAQANKSYLIMANIIAAAKTTGAEAVHPGYGFLAENADFARACADNDLVFIGPAPECIERMGDKSSARETMKACGVPTVPGSDGCIETAAEAKAFADSVGYPVLIKPRRAAAARVCAKCTTRPISRLSTSRAHRGRGSVRQRRRVPGEARAASAPRGDPGAGRRLRKQRRPVRARLLRAASSSEAHRGSALAGLTEDLRRAMGVAAIKAVRAVNYKNAGTIEFLLDERGSFYFMEMNTRVQVEHPVTEQITGTDIIKEQLRIASGEPMSCASRAPFSPAGHAIEFRIKRGRSASTLPPVPGTITENSKPRPAPACAWKATCARFAHLAVLRFAGGELVVYGQDREEALARGRRALDEFVIEGIETTIASIAVCSITRCSARAM